MGITVSGKAAMSGLFGGVAGISAMKYIAYGDGDTAFAKAQTALTGTESQRALATIVQETTTDTNDTVKLSYSFTVASSETAKEIGVFDAASGGNMGARTVLTTPKVLSIGSTYAVVYKFIVSSS